MDEQAKAPNTSFLFDPLLSLEEKNAILAQKPEIVKLHEIYKQHPTLKSAITSKKYFDEKTLNGGQGQIFVDLSNELNGQNMTRLNSSSPLSITKAAQMTGMDAQEVGRYINSGFFEPTKLIDKQTGEEVTIKAINWQSEVTQAGLERLKKLNDLAPKSSRAIESLKQQKKPLLVPLEYLSRIGYGTPQKIEEVLRDYKIPTKKIASRQGLVTVLDLDNPKARGILGYLEKK